MIRPTV